MPPPADNYPHNTTPTYGDEATLSLEKILKVLDDWKRGAVAPPQGSALNPGAVGFAAGQITVGSSPTLVGSASPARRGIVIKNVSGDTLCIGGPGVTAPNGSAPGYQLNTGETLTIDAGAAQVYAISASTTVCSFAETHD